jgi:branched-chain amino acid aminotransferase
LVENKVPNLTGKELSTRIKTLPLADDLGFGKHFSDHWFYSKFSTEKGWFESKIVPYGPMTIDPSASVLHYGQALFEGMKAFRQKDNSISVFRPHFNWERMAEGAARLCLEAPPEKLFMQGLKELLLTDTRWVPKEDNCALYIRPTLIGTEVFLCFRPSREIMFFILLSPVGSYYGKGAGSNKPVRIWVEDRAIRDAPGGLGATKAGANYAASLKSALEAKQKGFDQVLWLDSQFEGIEEVGTMNVFFVFKNEIVTPRLNGSILAGGVRDSVIQLLKHQGRKVNEKRITMSELLERHAAGDLLEAFGTGTAAVITAIGELQYKSQSLQIHQGQIGPVSQELFKTISGIQRGLAPDPFGWMVRVQDL